MNTIGDLSTAHTVDQDGLVGGEFHLADTGSSFPSRAYVDHKDVTRRLRSAEDYGSAVHAIDDSSGTAVGMNHTLLRRYAVAWDRAADGSYDQSRNLVEVRLNPDHTCDLGGALAAARGYVLVADANLTGDNDDPKDDRLRDVVVAPGGGVAELPLGPGGTETCVEDMNTDRTVVGSVATGSGEARRAVRWVGGSRQDIPLGEGLSGSSEAVAINDDGHVVVTGYDTDGIPQALLWRGGATAPVDMGAPEAPYPGLLLDKLEVEAINIHDQAVGRVVWRDAGSGERYEGAVIWRDGGWSYLLHLLPELDGAWWFVEATDINDAGHVVGNGYLAGRYTAFHIQPRPPVVYVPGMAASVLTSHDDADDPEDLWLGCFTRRLRLSLHAEDDPDRDVRARDAARYLSCGPLHGRLVDALDASGTFLEMLDEEHGYTEYEVGDDLGRRTEAGCDTTQTEADLFVFAYDWRRDNAEAAEELRDYIACVRRLHPGQDVDLVTHSMGSLVGRRYVLDHPRDHGIRRHVSVGAPWLGAPKLVNALETGEFVPYVVSHGEANIARLISGFPAAHQLMAGPAYHRLAGPVVAEDGWDYDGDGTTHERYPWPQLRAAVDARWPGTTPGSTAEAFHDRDGQDDWSDDSSGVHYVHLHGVQAAPTTITQVVMTADVTCDPIGLLCIHRDIAEKHFGQGDGTVPTTSATRVAAEDDLNAPRAEVVPFVSPSEDDDEDYEHTGLLRNPDVVDRIVDELAEVAGRPAAARTTASARTAAARTAAQASTSTVRTVRVRGARDVVAVDAEGKDSGVAPGTDVRPGLPGVVHVTEGAAAEAVLLDQTRAADHTVRFVGTGKAVSVEVLDGPSDAPTAATRWLDLVVPNGVTAELRPRGGHPPTLHIDDGNSAADSKIADAPVAPHASVTGAAAADIEAPRLAFTASSVDGERRVSPVATDDASGLRRVFWSADGLAFQAWTDQVPAPADDSIHAFAEDWAGNRSGIVEVRPSTLPLTPTTAATLAPPPGATGWTSGPVRVSLSAIPAGPDGTVEAIAWSAKGAVDAPETRVDGATADIEIGAAGTTRLRYRALASGDHDEPWRELTVRVDGAPPAAALTSPMPGTVVPSLLHLAGTAHDDASGVASIKVAVERTADRHHWDGEHWVAEPAWLDVPAGTRWRTLDVPTGEDLEEGAYAVRIRTRDHSGRTTVSQPAGVTVAATARMRAVELEAPTAAGGLGLDDDGTVTGLLGDGSGASVPVRWVQGSMERLPLLDGLARGEALASAAGGTAAGTAETSTGRRPLRWRQRPDTVAVEGLDHLSGAASGTVSAVGPDGVVVGSSGGAPALWPGDSRTPQRLPGLTNGDTGAAVDLDASGRVIGNLTAPDGTTRAVAWVDEVARRLAVPPGSARVTASNDVGDIVGTVTTNGRSQPFLTGYGDDEPVVLSGVGTASTHPTDINDGGMVVGRFTAPTGPRAFLAADPQRTPAVALDDLLEPGTGVRLTAAVAVNDAGQVLAMGVRDGTTTSRPFLVTAEHAPTAYDVELATAPQQAVDVRLGGHDVDPGDEIHHEVVDAPDAGQLGEVRPGGVVTYRPAPGTTVDRFTYQVTDASGLRSGTATVTIRVDGDGGAQPPVAVLDAPAEAAEGETVTLDASRSSDSDGNVVSYAWDLDADGDHDDATGVTAALAVLDDGPRVVSVEVTDDDGATARATTSVEGVGVAPALDAPATVSATVDQPWELTLPFTDPGEDTWSAEVTVAGRALPATIQGRSVQVTDTVTAVGGFDVVVEVCDDDGACGTATTRLTVRWPTTGLLSPVVDPPVWNEAKAGASIPIRFTLGGDRGLDVLTEDGPHSRSVPCNGPGNGSGGPAHNPGASGLTYDSSTGIYTWVWKTRREWAGQCRELVVGLADGSERRALFRLR